MKNFQAAGFFALLMLGFCSGTNAATTFITVDEFGNGLPYLFAADPTGGRSGSVLQYFLPFSGPVVTGDLGVYENTNHTAISDIIRFYNDPVTQRPMMIFYSSNDDVDPSPPLADTGLPLNGNPLLFVTEAGPPGSEEEFNIAEYFSGPGMPGFFGNTGDSTRYDFISDGLVPEPGVGALLLTGIGLLALHHRRAAA
jgi:hypothetical protein